MMMDPRRTSRFKAFIFLCAVFFLPAQTASFVYAGIISSSGVVILGGPPAPNVHEGSNELVATPPVPNAIVFPEFLNGVVPAGGVRVDHNGSVISSAPVRSGNAVNPAMVDTTIPAGTAVDSYFFHFDPSDVTFDLSNTYPAVTIQFDTQILGVQVFTSGDPSLQKPVPIPYVGTLEDGDTVDKSGAPGVQTVVSLNGGPGAAYYPGGVVARGLDEDTMGIDMGGFRIRLSGQVFGSETDQVRIFVAPVPEPSSIALLATGLLALSFLTIKRAGVFRRS